MAISETAARKLLHGGAIARGVADVGGLSFGPWDLITGFFANILAALEGVAHLLVLPLVALWQLLVTAVAGVAGAISSGLDSLWQHVTGFFAGIFAALASGAHQLVMPVEMLWQWLVTTIAAAPGAIISGLDRLWQHVSGFFAGIFAALAGTAHQLVLPLEALWKWLVTAGADAAGSISSGVNGLWRLITVFLPGVFAHLFAALAGAAHEVPPKLEAFWRWLQAAAAAALPYVLGVAAVVLLVAFVWFFWTALLAVSVRVSQALVSAAVWVSQALVPAACYLGYGVCYVGAKLFWVFASLLPCCAGVTMSAPGGAGMLISRAAFEAAPRLYFLILRAAGPTVAAAVFCTKGVAWLLAAPVAALFGSAGVA